MARPTRRADSHKLRRSAWDLQIQNGPSPTQSKEKILSESVSEDAVQAVSLCESNPLLSVRFYVLAFRTAEGNEREVQADLAAILLHQMMRYKFLSPLTGAKRDEELRGRTE